MGQAVEVLVAGAGAAAGALVGADAGAESVFAALESDPFPDDAAASPELAGAGFADEYRSLYHPEPLNCTAGAVRVRCSRPLQCGHVVNSGSENF